MSTTHPSRSNGDPTRPAPRAALRLLVLAVMSILGALALAVPAQAQSSYCGIDWGSTAKVQANTTGAKDHVDNVRAGRFPCYDRLVVDLGDAARYRGYDVRYVSAIHQEGSGATVPLRGGAKLQIVVYAENHDASGRLTYRPASPSEIVKVSTFATFRQVVWAGAFEGQSTIGVGTRARLPFRVMVLNGPHRGQSRLVVDVAHRW
jgi:hypothetical protein